MFSNTNKSYNIIWGKCIPVIESVFKGNEDFSSKSKYFDLLWLIQETKNITVGIGVKLNKSASLCHCIRSFINLQQG